MDHLLAERADAPPGADKRGFAKERRLYRKRIITRHVSVWVYPLKIEAGALLGHEHSIACRGVGVQ